MAPLSYPDSPPQIHTRLPAIKRSPSPTFLDSMKDLVPAPLRRSRSPMLGKSGERRNTPPITMLGARTEWGSYPPSKLEELPPVRSTSPLPSNPPAHIRARTQSPVRHRTSPQKKYHYIPTEYLTPERVNSLPVKKNQRPQLQPSKTSPVTNSPREFVFFPVSSRSPSGLEASRATRGPSRNNVMSMADYLSLEQLERLWQSQDRYKGTVDVPQKPASPMFRIAEEDPRSPILPAFLHELPSPPRPEDHPAFRRQVYSIHNSYARQAVQ